MSKEATKEHENNERLYGPVFQVVGLNSKKQIKWLLRFTQIALKKVTKNEQRALQEQVHVFNLFATQQIGLQLGFEQFDPDFMRLPISRSVLPSWATVQKAHKIAKTALMDVLNKQFIKLPPYTVQSTVFNQGTKKFPTWIHARSFKGHPAGAFINRLEVVIEAEAVNIARCSAQDCQKLFIKKRPKQEFCQPRCRVRLAMREIRARQHGKKAGDNISGKRGRPKASTAKPKSKKKRN